MFSYVYMKILETQPDRYDWGISWLSFGRAEAVQRRIVQETITRGSRVLDVGCGTGSLAVLAAQQGAEVVGLDVSPGMLAAASRKIAAQGLGERVALEEAGVAGMSKLPEASFDVVTATLVFSELSRDEQTYSLRQARRILKPGGRLALADEVRPDNAWKRLVYGAIRLPLLVITFALTQTGTRPVADLEPLVSSAGFRIEKAERSGLGGFLYLLAVKESA